MLQRFHFTLPRQVKQFRDRILTILRIRSPVGGLEIGDAVLRFAAPRRQSWQTISLPLPPGTVNEGTIQDPAQFQTALVAIHDEITGPHRRGKKVAVAVTVGSADIYTQTFSLPLLKNDQLEQAVELNLQMISPAKADEAYAGWQTVGRDEETNRLEILGAFVNRVGVDGMVTALQNAGFAVRSVESKGLSFARLLREWGEGLDPAQGYLTLMLDGQGLEFLVLRHAQLYFRYATDWAELYGGEKQITEENFSLALTRHLHQVINFYRSHWTEPLGGIYLVTNAMQDKIREILGRDFPDLPILDVRLSIGSTSPDWYLVLGSALRGFMSPREDAEVSLLGISAKEEFRRHQAHDFLSFWRMAVPICLGIFLAALILGDVLFTRMQTSAENKAILAAGPEAAEIEKLQTQVDSFNRTVTLIQAIAADRDSRVEKLEQVKSLADARGVSIIRLNLPRSARATLSGRARTAEDLRAFADALEAEPGIQAVNLPLSEVSADPDGVFFAMDFSYAAESAE